MSLANNKTFTLGELAKIALGGTEFTNDHLSVLQSLLRILLEKLNCHNETVRFNGFSAKCLKDLLNANPNGPQYNFQLEQIDRFNKKFELLEDVERRAQEVDSKMRQHCAEIHRCNKTSAFAANKWGFYSSPTEDLCTLYVDDNKEFCLLTCNTTFNMELRKRVYPLISERLTEFETKLDSIQTKLVVREQKFEKIAPAMDCVKFIIYDIEDARSSLQQNKKKFREAMIETQEMLNCKLHRQTLKALKVYLEKHFVAIKKFLSTTKEFECSPTRPLSITDKKTCLSCSRHQELEANKLFKTFVPADEKDKCLCGNFLKETTILTKLDAIRVRSSLSVAGAPTKSIEKNEKKNIKLFGDYNSQYDQRSYFTTERNSTDF